MLGERPGIALVQVAGHIGSAEGGEMPAIAAVWTQVVDSADMVVMAVGNQQCLERRGARA